MTTAFGYKTKVWTIACNNMKHGVNEDLTILGIFQKYQQNEELSKKDHDISIWKSKSCSGTCINICLIYKHIHGWPSHILTILFAPKDLPYLAFQSFGLGIPDEGYSRNSSCSIIYISTFLLWYYDLHRIPLKPSKINSKKLFFSYALYLLFLSWLCLYLITGGIVNRRSPFLQLPEYVDNFFPLCDQLEQEGRWKKEEITTFSRFMGEADGICIIYRVK